MNKTDIDKGQNVTETAGNRISAHQIRSDATRSRILAAARAQFVTNGLEGTRMEAIAAAAGLNKSLVYRHYGTREQLYREVLSAAYADVRDAEANLILPSDPLQALDQIVAFTFRYYIANPDFLVLVGIENLNGGEHLRAVDRSNLHVSSLMEILGRVIHDGTASGLFREDLDPIELYIAVASQAWFTVATRHTFGITFEVDVIAKDALDRRERLIQDNLRRIVLKRWPPTK